MDETKSKPRPRKTAAKTAAKKVAPGKVAPGYEIEDWLAAEAEVSVPQDAKLAARKPRTGGGGTG